MTDPAGTCHLVGCPGKGKHPPHGIGVGSWADYQKPDTLTEPKVHVLVSDVEHLLDWHNKACGAGQEDSDRALFHRLSFALAQHRNGPARAASTDAASRQDAPPSVSAGPVGDPARAAVHASRCAYPHDLNERPCLDGYGGLV